MQFLFLKNKVFLKDNSLSSSKSNQFFEVKYPFFKETSALRRVFCRARLLFHTFPKASLAGFLQQNPSTSIPYPGDPLLLSKTFRKKIGSSWQLQPNIRKFEKTKEPPESFLAALQKKNTQKKKTKTKTKKTKRQKSSD